MTELDLKTVCSKIDEEKDSLNNVSQSIWKNPELKFEEVCAHNILTEALLKHGFNVQKNYLLPTAFRAEYSSGEGPVIAVLLEYDALPVIGHACGHNLIAEAGLAAGIGIKAAMKADPNLKGKVVLLGTPAEESGGGKIKLINYGAFENIDAAMMVHPLKLTCYSPPIISRLAMIVEYKGKETHASAFPWEGINALDAAVNLYQSLGLLRQQMKPSCRIHAIIPKGGTVPNVIPAESSVSIYLRAPTKRELAILRAKVEDCIQGAATSTGCTFSANIDEENQYDDLVTNQAMCELFSKFSGELGLPQVDLSTVETIPVGSTDMGNVSYVVPSIHPFYNINTKTSNHTKEFTVAAGSSAAQAPTLTAGKAMAMTALSLMRYPMTLMQVKAEFHG